MTKFLVSVLLFCLGTLFGLVIYPNFVSGLLNRDKSDARQVREGTNTYTNPLLECEIGSVISEKKFNLFKQDLDKIIQEEKTRGEISQLALYYRDLNNGPWFGINEQDGFIPASLLKLPLAMAFYKETEEKPELLFEKIIYEGSNIEVPQHFKPGVNLVKGQTYSLEELVEHMLVYSDNVAAGILTQIIDDQTTKNIYDDLGLVTPKNYSEHSISVKDYASFLRVLYNSSYLSKTNSEKILGMLVKAQFERGIKGDLPANISVAHKFGEASLPDGTKQLHDCGIVYSQNNPFLLCVMTRGNNFDLMDKAISEISSTLFEKVNGK